jgi:hypothetical protein
MLMNPGYDLLEESEERGSGWKVRVTPEKVRTQVGHEPLGRLRGVDDGRVRVPVVVGSEEGDEDQDLNLARRSYENLVRFYEEELERITRGERATKVLSSYKRSHLLSSGVLRYGNLQWWVSEKAKKYLEEV